MNNQHLISQRLLSDFGLTTSHLEQALAMAHVKGADFSDIFLESTIFESWSLEDGLVSAGSFDLSQGVGVRVNQGEQSGLAYCDVLSVEGLFEAARQAKQIVRGPLSTAGVPIRVPTFREGYPRLYDSSDPRSRVMRHEQIELLQALDAYARAKDSRVIQVLGTLVSEWSHVLVMGSDGVLAGDIRPLVRLSVTVVMESNGLREQGFSGQGGRYSLEHLMKASCWQSLVDAACAGAARNLEAKPTPAGPMDVVLGAGWPGVLIHEAVGHGLEGDFNRKQSSAFSGRMGEMIASPLCSIVDDGTLPELRGSLSIDDEGTPTSCTPLIEKGRLVGYMHDKLSARVMGLPPTGNGRRESYAHKVLPRMTNTYMLPGAHTPEEIIASMDRGLYAVNFNGGQVDITSGKFVFAASEAYWVEKGKIQYPVKGATLIGDGPSALMRVTMVGNDLKLDPGIGVCGKDGQSVPVGVGQPTVRMNDMVVGGAV
jgi:TldD protein